jgi:hypothetical protein
MKPMFTHDCDECTYIGQTSRHPHNVVDVYRHNDTLILRYGDDGPQYYAWHDKETTHEH